MNKDAKTWKVLLVDDEPDNLKLLQQILKSSYTLSFAKSGPEALASVSRNKPDLLLLDIMMPGMDGYEVCRKLKADQESSKIPVVFVTALGEEQDESNGFKAGGVDYIRKPVSGPIVKARVATHLALYNQHQACERKIIEQTSELNENQKAAVSMLGEAGHYNDTDTGVHIWRMAAYASALARADDWDVDLAATLELAAPMHDTGKIGTPDSILKKPAKLDPDEWEIMKQHSMIGHSILSKSDTFLFNMAADIALSHHEKWNGSGYPYGLVGEEIPKSAQIVAVADVFDALTMTRPYKKPWPIDASFFEIQQSAGAHFNPRLVQRFLAIEDEVREIKKEWDAREEEEKCVSD